MCVGAGGTCTIIRLLGSCFPSFYPPALLYKGTLYTKVNLEHS